MPTDTPELQPSELADEQIKHMVERFLQWKLPANFNPDNGISAQRPNYGPGVEWQPTGTNLFDYTHAEAMVRHMIDGLTALRTPSEREQGLEAEAMARRFHEAYERLAPLFGYETRPETRQFDPDSPNGKLMIAVCQALGDQHDQP